MPKIYRDYKVGEENKMEAKEIVWKIPTDKYHNQLYSNRDKNITQDCAEEVEIYIKGMVILSIEELVRKYCQECIPEDNVVGFNYYLITLIILSKIFKTENKDKGILPQKLLPASKNKMLAKHGLKRNTKTTTYHSTTILSMKPQL